MLFRCCCSDLKSLTFSLRHDTDAVTQTLLVDILLFSELMRGKCKKSGRIKSLICNHFPLDVTRPPWQKTGCCQNYVCNLIRNKMFTKRLKISLKPTINVVAKMAGNKFRMTILATKLNWLLIIVCLYLSPTAVIVPWKLLVGIPVIFFLPIWAAYDAI